MISQAGTALSLAGVLGFGGGTGRVLGVNAIAQGGRLALLRCLGSTGQKGNGPETSLSRWAETGTGWRGGGKKPGSLILLDLPRYG